MQQHVKPEVWYVVQRTWTANSDFEDVSKHRTAVEACVAHASIFRHKSEKCRVIIRFEHFWNGDL